MLHARRTLHVILGIRAYVERRRELYHINEHDENISGIIAIKNILQPKEKYGNYRAKKVAIEKFKHITKIFRKAQPSDYPRNSNTRKLLQTKNVKRYKQQQAKNGNYRCKGHFL